MIKTMKNFKIMTEGFKVEVGFKEITELSNYYKETEDQRCIAFIYIDQFGHLYEQTKRFKYLTDEDRVSLILVEIEKALLNYDETKGAKLQTLVSTYVYRTCYAENNKRGYHKRVINYDNEISSSYELYIEQGVDWGKQDRRDFEFVDFIKNSNLTTNEKKYCLIVGLNNHKLTDSEVADEMGVTPSAIHYIKKRLRDKLEPVI